MSNRSEGDGHDVRERVDAAVLRSWGLPQPGRTKQSRGDAVIGGASRRTPGAVILAFEAAMRVGVGRVAVLVPGSVEEQLGAHLPEAAVFALPDDPAAPITGALDAYALAVLADLPRHRLPEGLVLTPNETELAMLAGEGRASRRRAAALAFAVREAASAD